MNPPRQRHEYETHLNRLKGVFGESCYRGDRVKMILKSASLYTPEEFGSVIDGFILHARQPPLPVDIRDALRNRFGIRPVVDRQVIEAYVVRCEWCLDTGFMELQSLTSAFRTFCYCHCALGKKGSVYSFPHFTDALRTSWKPVPRDLKWLKPTKYVEPKENDPRLSWLKQQAGDKIRALRHLYHTAERFWCEQLGLAVPDRKNPDREFQNDFG